MSTYNYDLPVDFSGGFDKHQFILELKRQFTKEFKLSNYGDRVKLHFLQSLTSEEETDLDSIISNHDPAPPTPKEKFFSINPHTTRTRNTNWTTCFTFEFPGSFHVKTIDYIHLISRIQNSWDNFDIRVVDLTNRGNIIAQLDNQNNTSYLSLDLGTISNVPEEPALLEIQVKSSSKRWIYLSQAIVYYGNS